MTQSVIQTRIDKAVKLRAEKIFSRLGLTLNDGIRMFVNQVTIDCGMPFRPLVGDKPNEETVEAMKELDSGKGHVYSDVKSLMKDIRA